MTSSLPPRVIEPIFSVLTYSFRLPGREFKSCKQDADLPQSSIFKSSQSPAAFQTHRNKFPGSDSPAACPLCGSAQPSVRLVPRAICHRALAPRVHSVLALRKMQTSAAGSAPGSARPLLFGASSSVSPQTAWGDMAGPEEADPSSQH